MFLAPRARFAWAWSVALDQRSFLRNGRSESPFACLPGAQGGCGSTLDPGNWARLNAFPRLRWELTHLSIGQLRLAVCEAVGEANGTVLAHR
jgi:hypothetical protein